MFNTNTTTGIRAHWIYMKLKDITARVLQHCWRAHYLHDHYNTWRGKIAHMDGASTCCLIMKCTISGTHWLGGNVSDPTTLLKYRRLLSSSSSHQARRVEQSWQEGAHTCNILTHLPITHIIITNKVKTLKVQFYMACIINSGIIKPKWNYSTGVYGYQLKQVHYVFATLFHGTDR